MNILTLGSDCYKVLFNPLPDLSDKMDRYAIYRLSSKAQTSLFKLIHAIVVKQIASHLPVRPVD